MFNQSQAPRVWALVVLGASSYQYRLQTLAQRQSTKGIADSACSGTIDNGYFITSPFYLLAI